MEKQFRIIITLAFLLLLFVTILFLGELVKPVWNDDPMWEPATDIIRGFYAEEEQSLDVLFLGSSHIFCGVNPLAIYQETGLKSYDLASGSQRMWISYHYLLEALKTQTPQVVVLDTGIMFEDRPNEEGRNRMAIDYMKPSSNKWDAARASLNEDEGETMLSYYFPLFRFHDRILDLEKEDFTLYFQDPRNPLHGYRYAYMDKVTPVSPLFYDASASEPAELWSDGSRALDYLRKIISLCNEKGIKLVLITVPVTVGWSAEQSAAMAEFAAENGLIYRDFTPETKDLGLSGDTHFYDAKHLNTAGADIFSRQLGIWLLDTFFEGKHQSTDPVWDADLLLLES